MITAQQFKQRWESVGPDRLVSFPKESLADVRLSADARSFLIEAGLPEQAAPFLDFGPPKSGTLERVSVVWHQPTEFGRYRIIGSNGSGDPVCLDEEREGQIVCLNHDNRFESVLMAASVFTLAECLVELRDLITGAGGTEDVTQEQYAALLARLQSIDPAASPPGGYWEREIGCLRPTKLPPWWQFWKK